MRRYLILTLALLPLVAACSSSDKPAAPPDSTTPATAPTTTATTVPATTSTTGAVTTTTVACHGVGTTEPIVTATTGTPALLRAVAASGGRCADRVTFDFTTDANKPPKCTIVYSAPPFTMDGSGAPVTVSGSAFIKLRCEPAYGYDYAGGGGPTYTGPKQITPTGTQHVQELVQTGDFEGVLNWVIGLDSKRPFSAATATVPGPQARTRLAIRFY